MAQTWQVTRSEFDKMLLDNARDKGAEVREQVAVNELLIDDGRVIGVDVTDHDGHSFDIRGEIVLDCSGKEAFTAGRLGWRHGPCRLPLEVPQ